MNILKRAYLNVIRNLGKSSVFLLIVFLLGTLLSAGISVRNAIYQTDANLWETLPAIATLAWEGHEFGYFDGTAARFEFPTTDMIEDVGALSYVRDYDFVSRSSLKSRYLEGVTPQFEQLIPDDIVQANPELISELEFSSRTLREQGAYVETIGTTGINSLYPTDLQAGLISLVAGRFMTQAELDDGLPVAVVPRLFAEHNNLHIGSTIILENVAHDVELMIAEGLDLFFLYWHLDDFILASQVIEFEVIGIFDVNHEMFHIGDERVPMLASFLADFHNSIYIPHRHQEEIARYILPFHFDDNSTDLGLTMEHPLILQPTFLLNNPRDLVAFSEAASEIIPENWRVHGLTATFGLITNSMDTMLGISNLIFFGAVVSTVVVLSLLISLFLRDRKYEIGIYLALGESRGKILCQIFIEVFSISLVAITLALFAGDVLSSGISRQMLEQDLIRQEQALQDEFPDSGFLDFGFSDVITFELMFFDSGPMSVEEMMAAYDTSLDVASIVLFFSVQIVAISLSIVIPSLYIWRLEPKEILIFSSGS